MIESSDKFFGALDLPQEKSESSESSENSESSDSDFELEEKNKLTPKLTLHQKQDIKISFISTFSDWLPRTELNNTFPEAKVGRTIYNSLKNLDMEEFGIHRSEGVALFK